MPQPPSTAKHHNLAPAQIRAARALIGWSSEDLARASTVGVATIRRAELAKAQTVMTAPNDIAIRRALEGQGVEFIEENGGGPGVRLTKAAAAGVGQPPSASGATAPGARAGRRKAKASTAKR